MSGGGNLVFLSLQVLCLYGMAFGPSEGFRTFAGVYGLFIALAAVLYASFEANKDNPITLSVLAAIFAYSVVSVGAFLTLVWPVRALLVAFGVVS